MISLKGLPFNSPTDRLVYYLEPDGTQVIVHADGRMEHPRRKPGQRKELEMRIRIDKLLFQISKQMSPDEFRFLKEVPERINLRFFDVWKETIEKKMTPQDAVKYVMGLYRYHGLLWRG